MASLKSHPRLLLLLLLLLSNEKQGEEWLPSEEYILSTTAMCNVDTTLSCDGGGDGKGGGGGVRRRGVGGRGEGGGGGWSFACFWCSIVYGLWGLATGREVGGGRGW